MAMKLNKHGPKLSGMTIERLNKEFKGATPKRKDKLTKEFRRRGIAPTIEA